MKSLSEQNKMYRNLIKNQISIQSKYYFKEFPDELFVDILQYLHDDMDFEVNPRDLETILIRNPMTYSLLVKGGLGEIEQEKLIDSISLFYLGLDSPDSQEIEEFKNFSSDLKEAIAVRNSDTKSN
ncbi:MAG: hypothetical protein AAF620_01335 [Bacteroidota bacterium]